MNCSGGLVRIRAVDVRHACAEEGTEGTMKIGITGAGGNLGSVLVRGLQAKHDLKLFDRHLPTSAGRHDFTKLDLADASQLSGVFAGLDALLHLAGNPSPSAPRADTLRNNFVATSFVFEEARKAGVRKIVFASSNFYHQKDIASALRGGGRPRIPLEVCATPDCPYAESKVYGENLGFHYANLGINFVALRIGWCVPEDTPVPYDSAYMRAMFCSQRDLLQAFERGLETEEKFMAAFVVSDNAENVFDLSGTRRSLGFHPQDNAANYY
jgi:NAD+ dependent glucose-6-phosphate dehydrogenase